MTVSLTQPMFAAVVHCRGQRFNTAGTTYIGRPSPFGNPFVAKSKSEADRALVVEQYRAWFTHGVQTHAGFRARMLSLQGQDLACWCAPRTCHGDIILAWLSTQSTS